jgi:hypothetical protein
MIDLFCRKCAFAMISSLCYYLLHRDYDYFSSWFISWEHVESTPDEHQMRAKELRRGGRGVDEFVQYVLKASYILR